MLGPEACPPADLQVNEPPLEVGSQLCTQCGLCCNGALHKYAVLEPDEVDFARGLGLTLRTEGRPGFSLPCPRLCDSKCSIYQSRPKVCGNYKCQLLQDLEAGATVFESAIEKVLTAKDLIARLDVDMPKGMTIPEVRMRFGETDSAETIPTQQDGNMRLKLAIIALSLYLDRHFGKSKEGKLLSFEALADRQATTEMK